MRPTETSSTQSTKHSVDVGSGDQKEFLVFRIANRNRWYGKSSGSREDVAEASKDFQLRDGEDYLSFYAVADEKDARDVAVAFKITGDGRPDKVDYIVFPGELLEDVGVELRSKPDENLIPFLSNKHLGTFGYKHEPGEDFVKTLMNRESAIPLRMSKNEIKVEAKILVKKIPDLSVKIGQHWKSLVFDLER